jgi:hypothetical protein
MGLLQCTECAVLSDSEISDQRTIGCDEAQRGAYGGRWRLWFEVLIPNAGLLLNYWAPESSLLVG